MMVVVGTGLTKRGTTLTNKIVVPDAAIREYNEKYGKYFVNPVKPYKLPLLVDEDAMYLQAMGLSTEEMDSGFKSSK